MSQQLSPAILFIFVVCQSASAYTPDSPEVCRAVDRAADYLATAQDARLGAKALAARAMIYLEKPEHPCVGEALEAVRRELAGAGDEQTRIYSLGLAIAMLAELDARRYRIELNGLTAMLVERQKSHGGWGYPQRPTGDTSMTQYAVYGLWNAARAGVEVDDRVWTRAVDWLLRTQDPGGGWGYQGIDSKGAGLVPQAEVRRSLTEAALASLYLGGERFRLVQFTEEDRAVVPQLRPVKNKPQAARPTPFTVARFESALNSGNRWDRDTREPIFDSFPNYHLYTIERYQTFRTAAMKTASKESEAWYDSGVEYLLKTQNDEGAWGSPEGPMAATGFAVLFLLRTTRMTIRPPEGIGSGTLVGGRGLPQDGKSSKSAKTPSSVPTSGPGDDLAALVRKLEDPQFLATLSGVESQSPSADAPPPSALRKRLAELAKSDSPHEQAAALTAIGRLDDFDQVPLLIEALKDARQQVHQAAVDALRYLARRSEEIGRPLPSDEASRLAEATRWREWYRSIRPPAK